MFKQITICFFDNYLICLGTLKSNLIYALWLSRIREFKNHPRFQLGRRNEVKRLGKLFDEWIEMTKQDVDEVSWKQGKIWVFPKIEVPQNGWWK